MNKKLNLKILLPDEAHQGYCPSIVKGFALLKAALIDCLLHGKKLHVRAMYSQVQKHMEKLTKSQLFRFLPIITETSDEKIPNTKSYSTPYGVRPIDYQTGIDYDSTCPNVKKVFDTVKRYSDLGYPIIVVSDSEGWGGLIAQHVTGSPCTIVNCEDLILNYFYKDFVGDNKKIVIVSCTSTRPDYLNLVISNFQKEFPDCEFLDKTHHCPTIKARGKAALELAKKCDRMILIGDDRSMQIAYYASLIANYYRQMNCENRMHKILLFKEPEDVFDDKFHINETVGIISATSISKSKTSKFVKRLQRLKVEEKSIVEIDYRPYQPETYMCPGTQCNGECNKCC